MGLFERKRKKLERLPAVLTEQDDPVNYNSVLEYLTGLSRHDYDKMLKVSGIYRTANKEAAKVLNVPDAPTTELLKDKPTDDQIDEGLDKALIGDFIDDGPVMPKTKKAQSTKPKQVETK